MERICSTNPDECIIGIATGIDISYSFQDETRHSECLHIDVCKYILVACKSLGRVPRIF